MHRHAFAKASRYFTSLTSAGIDGLIEEDTPSSVLCPLWKGLSVDVSEDFIGKLLGFPEITPSSSRFFFEKDRANFHRAIQRLGHVVGGQGGHTGRR